MHGRHLWIILLLLGSVAGPVLYNGWREVQAAERALAHEQYDEAARLYSLAARQLPWRRVLWERAGLAAFRAAHYEDAIRWLESTPLSGEGWLALGLAYRFTHRPEAARQAWQMGLQAQPSYAPLYDQLAIAYHEDRDYASEQDLLIRRLQLGDSAWAHYRLGLLLSAQDFERALQELRAASSLDPQFAPAAETLRAALSLAARAPSPASRLVTVGRGLGLLAEWGLASRAFEQAVALAPQEAEAWAWLGEARQHIGQDGKEALDRALALDAHKASVHALRGLYWKRLGRAQEALEEYRQAVQIEPGNPAWWAALGEAYRQRGDLVAGLSAYQEATHLAAHDSTYWRLLALFSAENGVQVMEIGLPAAQKAVELAPSDPQALDVLGLAYFSAGYLYHAEQALRASLQADPEFALAHLHLAQVYLRKGDRAAAFRELQQARQRDPQGAVAQAAAELLARYFSTSP